MCSYADNHGTLGISDLPGMRKKLSISSHDTLHPNGILVQFFWIAQNVYRSVVHELVQSPPFKEPRKYVRTHQKKPKEIFQIF